MPERKEKTILFSLRLPLTLHRKLKKVSDGEKMSVAVRKALKKYLANVQ